MAVTHFKSLKVLILLACLCLAAEAQTGEWTWMAGSNLANQQGVLDTATPSSNVPPGLTDAAGWTDSSGNLWLFGGDTINSPGATGSVNGLWEYKP